MDVPETQTKIFISYRRSGEVGFVGRLNDRLSSVYGEPNVFRDISGLRSGEAFEKRIGSKISEATVVIAVIGADWIGRRYFRKSRILTEGDWVRKELEHALASEIPVIPVLVGDAALPTRDQLPTSLKGLLSVHTGRIRDESWDNDTSELIRAIDDVARSSQSEDGEISFVWRRAGADKPNRLQLVFALIALVAVIGVLLTIYLTRNRNGGTVRLDDPATWTAPPPSEARSPIAHLALQLALLELQASTKESNVENAGFNVAKFTQRFGIQSVPWSPAFVGWCYLEATKRKRNNNEVKLPFTDSPSTQIVAASLRKSGWLVEPFDAARARPGDIIFFRRGPQMGHMEIVYAVSSGLICSIGGNVNDQVSGRCTPIGSENLLALGAIPQEAFE